MNFTRIEKLSNLITKQVKRKPTIILDPTPEKQTFRIVGTAKDVNAAIDADEWEISEELKAFVSELAQKEENLEEKILDIYVKLCKEYTYDDNTLSYIKNNGDDTFFLPDEYGRDTDDEWKENRKKHDRRNCFEISRVLAKSFVKLIEELKLQKRYDVCIIWDEAVTHYFVAIASDDYYVTLDLDDFNQIKDLTRMKTGLTLEGISLLEDTKSKFRNALANINKFREYDSQDAIVAELSKNDRVDEKETNRESEDIIFLQHTIQILKEKYNLDSAGMFEYLKEIVDSKCGRQNRSTMWKKVETEKGQGARYTRCLKVNIDDNEYLIDVTKELPDEIFLDFHQLNEEEQKSVIRFSALNRNWEDDPYDGR